MSEPRRLQSRRVLRQMDHLIMALSVDADAATGPGGEPPRPGFLLSLYWIEFTVEVSQRPLSGHVAYAWSDGADGGDAFEAILTDAPEIARGLGERMRPGQWPMADPDRTFRRATFQRRLTQPWGIDYRVTSADGLMIEARWADLSPAVFGTGPARGGAVTIATVLTESTAPSVRINGRPYPGSSFPNPIWTPWFGSGRGSCILGLGETIYEPLD